MTCMFVCGWIVAFAALYVEPARSQVQFSAQSDQTTVAYPETQAVSYSLTMVTGAQPEKFAVEIISPQFMRGNGLFEGASALLAGPLTISGPGTLGARSDVIATLRCSTRQITRIHGFYEVTGLLQNVSIPASSSSTLKASFLTGFSPPWVNTSLAPVFRVTPNMAAGEISTINGEQMIPAPAPIATGNRGVEIEFDTKPADSPIANTKQAPTIKRRGSVAFRGAITPGLRRARIRLAYYAPGSRKLKTIGRTETNRKGRFRWPDGSSRRTTARAWRPRKPGSYELWAFVKPRSAGFAPDFSCPRGLRVLP